MEQAHREGTTHETCDMNNARIQAAISTALERFSGQSAVLYGSYANDTADEHSDIDILIIDSNDAAPIRFEDEQIDQVHIDLTIGGRTTYPRKLITRTKYNNNWILNAFYECRILRDIDERAAYLKQASQRIFGDGPIVMTREEVEQGCAIMRRQLFKVETMQYRNQVSPAVAKATQIRCDQIAYQAIYLYFCARRRWTMSLPKLLDLCSRDYPAVYALWTEYASEGDLLRALPVIKRLVNLV
jgi:predicted nucleotidyltransferase